MSTPIKTSHVLTYAYAVLASYGCAASCTSAPVEHTVTSQAERTGSAVSLLCDPAVYCSDVLGFGADPSLLCDVSHSATVWNALVDCECSGACAAACGSYCSGGPITADCKSCITDPIGCRTEWNACLNDAAPLPPPPPCDICPDSVPLCTGAETIVWCNGDELCPNDTDLCVECCPSITSCNTVTYCASAP